MRHRIFGVALPILCVTLAAELLRGQAVRTGPATERPSEMPVQYKVIEKSSQTMVVELPSAAGDKPLYLLCPRPVFDSFGRGPEIAYAAATDSGAIKFRVIWPTGLNEGGDRKRLEEAYGKKGRVVHVASTKHIDRACCLVSLPKYVCSVPVDPLHPDVDLVIPLTEKGGQKPSELLDMPNPQMSVEFMFRIRIDDLSFVMSFSEDTKLSKFVFK